MKRAVILDTSAIMYRSHFALMGMRNSSGMSTGATFGFINTLESVIREFRPDYLVACLDVKRDELERTGELETYKAHRESMPEELVMQIDTIMKVLDGYRIPKYKKAGQEADDVIATFATKFSNDEDEQIEVFVITGDKDLAQLVDGKINIALLGKGDKNSAFKHIKTDEDVVEYLGVTPDKIPDLFGLMGDKSDGIPGVTGIGPKNGVKLITTYGNLEGIYENIDEIKGKQKEKLLTDKENAFISRELATVKRELDIEYDKNKLKFEEKDFDSLLKLYEELDFKRFSKAVEEEKERFLQSGNQKELTEKEKLVLEKNKKIAEEKLEKERFEREKVEKQELEYDKKNPIFDGISHFYEHVEYEHNSEIDKKIDEIQVLKEKLAIEYETQKKKAEEIALENQKTEKTKKIKDEKVYFEKNYGKVISWNNAYSVIEKMDKKVAIFENMLGLSICDEKMNIVLLDSELQYILQNGNQKNAESGVQINLFSLSDNANEQKDNKKNIENIYKLLSKKEIIAYNVKEYMKNGESEYFGYSVGGKTYGINEDRFGIKCTEYFDILLARYVLGTESLQEIEEIILDEFGVEIATFEEQFKKERRKKDFSDVSDDVICEFLSKRTFFIYKLETIFRNRLQNEQFLNIFDKLESRLIPVLAQMEETGIKIDKRYFSEFQNELEEKINMLQSDIYKLADGEFNIDSPQQLGEVLFEKLQIPSGKKTKTGYSTNVEVLEMIANNGELTEDKRMIGKKLLEYRAYKKLLSTYIEPIPKLVDKEDRIHTTFNQNGTSTGRLSSANPNLQNIPVRTDDGIRIRTGFVSKEGHSLISFDYSQIELRVLAELSKDRHLVQAYQDNQDLHNLTARKIFFKTEEDEISRHERSIAKVINFSILYGKTPFGLSKELGITVQEASQYITTYFEEYPRVRKFLDIVTETAKLHGFVETFYGTRRYISGINATNKNVQAQAVRMAVNTVVQGTAANIIKKVMIELHEEFKNDENIKMLLQVHDELIFEVRDEFAKEYMKKIEKIMENTVKFKKVPLKANGSVAKNWGLLK
ncbi:DNA polymerase I [Leptotrichia sp. oral taxon 223]|uniref:DNA polymerase I n=1 Tax=Leptotrichia sp. oral taxon 223 TaxID=712363 RepID=UPI0015BDA36F|nr:DNA polymerase I [Leptotrichia sp. oral taxon 223]NWO20110.1 DNA polymerase I [Leptotrichia sp. oral taxon 223]